MKIIRNNLSVAACALFSQNVSAVEAIDNAWEVDSTLLYYSEDDDRVSVTKAVGTVKGVLSDTDSAKLMVVFDTMSGATPSGAVKKSSLSFTGASGGGISASGTSTALADFDDTRAAFNLEWDHQYSRTFNIVYGGAFSVENDYRSFSASATANKETSDKAYKFTLGIAGTMDEIFRVGGNDTPVPLSRVESGLSFGEGERDTTDIIMGVTHVINRRTAVQFNLTYGISKGYHTDPYKVFSIVDEAGNELDQYTEGRPDERKRTAIAVNLNHQIYPSNNIMHVSYRYYTDDWDVDAHTLSYSHHLKLKQGYFFEPNVRLYTQTKASFYYNSVVRLSTDTRPIATIVSELPDGVASADYRLDDMDSFTLGVTYGKRTSSDGKIRARLLYISQSFENSEFDTNKAFVFQVSFGKRF